MESLMAIGPFLLFKDRRDLDRMLDGVRSFGIRAIVIRESNSQGVPEKEIHFCTRWAKVVGSEILGGKDPMLYLGCARPFSPFVWWVDMRLLSRIEAIMVSLGSVKNP